MALPTISAISLRSFANEQLKTNSSNEKTTQHTLQRQTTNNGFEKWKNPFDQSKQCALVIFVNIDYSRNILRLFIF